MKQKSEAHKQICDEHYTDWGVGCDTCPLLGPCRPQIGDDYDKWIKRMNDAADKLEVKDD